MTSNGRPNDSECRTRDRHRRQPRRAVRGAGAVRTVRPGHGLRARRASRRAGQPRRGAAGPPRPPADGARRRRSSSRCSPVCSTTWSPRACRSWRTGPTASTSAPPATCSARQHRLRDEFTAYVPSRPHLEWQIRRRVLDIPNVTLVRRGRRPSRRSTRPQRVTGVRLDAGERRSTPTWSSTRQGAAPGCRCGWSSGDLSVRRRTPSTSASATPPIRCAFPDGLFAEKVVVAGRVAGAAGRPGDALLRGRHLGRDHVRDRQGRAAAPISTGMCALADEILPAACQRRAASG